MRSAGASSALAVALLGLGAPPAGASGTAPFELLTGAANPLQGVSTGAYSFSHPAFGDLDGDGDLDLVAGQYDGKFYYFRKDPSGFTSIVSPLASFDVGFHSTPALGDLDGDGDLDLVSGESNGGFRYYENTGDAETAAFVERTGSANPLNGQDVGQISVPALGDLDGDGDLDVVAGEYDGFLNYFENTGNAKSPVFAARTGAANPLDGQDLGLDSTLALGDFDLDGDLDVVAGEAYAGSFFVFENTGSRTAPAFVARTGAASPLFGQNPGLSGSPVFVDLDRDGDLDLVAGNNTGSFTSFENRRDRYVERTGAANPLAGVDVGYYSLCAFGDLDGDGDLDGFAGSFTGTFRYFQNTGTAAAPVFVERTGSANPLNGFDVGDRSTPSLGDLDGDGDLDVMAGASDGLFYYFRNTGSATSPAFESIAGPAFGQSAGTDSAPTFGDLDGDGDLDMVSGNRAGVLRYFLNTGSATSPNFAYQPGSAGAPTPGDVLGSLTTPALGDLDGDGDLDLVSGTFANGYTYFENTGSAKIPVFARRTGAADPLRPPGFQSRTAPAFADLDGDGDLDIVSGAYVGTFQYFESFVVQARLFASEAIGAANPLAGRDVGTLSSPALVDLDADGDPDLIVGEASGGFFFFENTGNATSAAFTARTGSANPLSGRDVGDGSKPAFADLDADGDFDLVSGSFAGDLYYFENTGDARTPLFAAPLVNPFGLDAVASDSSAPVFANLDGDGDLDLLAGEYSGFSYFENDYDDVTAPHFLLRTGALDPLDGETPTYASPALGDFDRDGDPDLYVGAAGGRFTYFRNAGTAVAPILARLPSPHNPLATTDLGSDSAPAAADLDGDGDLDLVTGALDGSLHVHFFPEPARAALLAAGASLLSWLGRWRRRPRRRPSRR